LKITVKREFEYIPEWNGNREDGGTVKAVIKNLSVDELDQCFTGGREVIDRKRLFALGLARLDGLELNGEKIDTAQKVLDAPALHGLYIEICAEVLRVNQRQDLKN